MGTGLCALAQAKLAKFVNDLRQASGREKVTTAIKAGFFAGVKTPLRALTGTSAFNTFRILGQQPAETGVDYLLAVGKSARTGFTVSPAEFRTIALALDKEGLGVMLRGFREGGAPIGEALGTAKAAMQAKRAAGVNPGSAFGHGIAAFIEDLQTRLDADHVAHVTEYERTKYANPIVHTMVSAPYAILDAAHRPFWRAAFDASLYMQAKVRAIREVAQGAATEAEQAARAKSYFTSPTEEMIDRARDDASYSVFQDKNRLSETASGLKRGLATAADKAPDPNASPYRRGVQKARQTGARIGSLLAETNFPVTGVPSSEAAKIATMTPLGLLSPKVLGGQAHLARAVATSGLGAAFMAAGYAAAKAGRVAGPLPEDPKERAQWEAERKQPYSVRIGDEWIGGHALGSVGVAFFMGANLHEIHEKEPDASTLDVAGKQAAFAARTLTEATYLANVKKLIDAASGNERSGASVVASQVPVPPVAKQVTDALDPYQRETNTLGQKVLAKLPGGSFALPKALDQFGQPIEKTPGERIANAVSPFPVKQAHDSPLLAEMDRLGVAIGKPGKNVAALGVQIPRDPEAYRQLVADVGPRTQAALEQLVASPEYQAANDEDRKTAIEALVREVRAAANAKDREAVYDDLRAGRDTPQTKRLRSRLPK